MSLEGADKKVMRGYTPPKEKFIQKISEDIKAVKF